MRGPELRKKTDTDQVEIMGSILLVKILNLKKQISEANMRTRDIFGISLVQVSSY